jgi:hypothetical protein
MEKVHLNFRYTEKEYLSAIRLYVWNTSELLLGWIVLYALLSAGLVLLTALMGFVIPVWALAAMIGLLGVSLFHGVLIDRPRRYFRGDPKFRDEYNLTFSDSGIEFRTANINASMAWSMYTRVIETDAFYLTVYGRDIHSVSVLPKRAFVDSKQETIFRQLLRRHVDQSLKLGPTEREGSEYLPPKTPPDWR